MHEVIEDVRAWQQPKHEAARYVSQHGFRVPRIFEPKEAADFVRTGGTVIARSEHTGDLTGPAGILESFVIAPGNVSGKTSRSPQAVAEEINPGGTYGERILWRCELMDHFGTHPDAVTNALTVLNAQSPHLETQARMQGVAVGELRAGVSTTLWEFVQGVNVTMTKDPSILGTWHIMASGGKGSDYVVYDGNVCQDRSVFPKNHAGPILTSAQMHELAEVYEGIAALPHFAELGNQSPIMELQVGEKDGDIYFLQYRVGAPTCVPPEKPLDTTAFSCKDGWVPTIRVRGATPNGRVMKVHMGLYPPRQLELLTRHSVSGVCTDGPTMTGVGDNICAPVVTVYVLGGKEHMITDPSHGSREPFIRPPVALLVPGGTIWEENERLTKYEEYRKARVPVYSGLTGAIFLIEYASDGKKGFVRRVYK